MSQRIEIYFPVKDEVIHTVVERGILFGMVGPEGPPGPDGEPGQPGEPGEDGQTVELRVDSGFIQWSYVGTGIWYNLIDTASLTGPQGQPGPQGAPGANGTNGTDGTDGADGSDGREVELQNSGTYIQWRYVGDPAWTNLVLLSVLKGDKGDKGDTGNAGPGLPTGGSVGQYPRKNSVTNYDTVWATPDWVDLSSAQNVPGKKTFTTGAVANAIDNTTAVAFEAYNLAGTMILRLFGNRDVYAGAGVILRPDTGILAYSFRSRNGLSYLNLDGGSFTMYDGSALLTASIASGSFRALAAFFGAGLGAPVASAVLEASSTTKGFLPPRMTQAQRLAISSPAVGLQVYQTDGTEGLYQNKSTGWAFIA